MTGVNVPLLRKTLEHITAHPEEHIQSTWALKRDCGTACCLAGWAVQFAGHEIDWSRGILCEGGGLDSVNVKGMGRTTIDLVAEDVLGLPMDWASRLYRATNTLADLWQLASEFTDGEIEIPAEFR